MPEAVKFSQAFYDRLGHPVADEMVQWFNRVDATNRSDLKELNELNFARFEAKLDQRFAEFAQLMDQRYFEFSRAVERQLNELRLEMKDFAISLKEQQVVQMRWMIGMWMVVLVAVMGLWIRR